MSVHAPNVAPAPPATDRSRGGVYLWAGVAACLLGIALVFVQFSLKIVAVPWYTPILATLGVVLLLVALVQRWSRLRFVALLLVAALAGLEWYGLLVLVNLKLPPYEGPAQPGTQFPAFTSTYADGRQFSDADCRDGSRRVMTFFRGRW
jgi:hypothetical protein